MSVVQETAKVVSNKPVADGLLIIRLHSPQIAAQCQPAQFVHVRCGDGIDPLLLRPFSMLTVDRQAGTLDILYQVVGRGTEILKNRRAGEEILQLGPLGKTFTTPPNQGNLLMVGGGIGTAPLVFLAEMMIPRGHTVTLLAGARTAARHLPAEFVPPAVEYVLATDDGSAGYHGPVTDLIADYFLWSDAVYICGPWPMLTAVDAAYQAREWGWHSKKPIQVSLENQMGCAMGVCLGCVVTTPRGYQRVCRDGPVFALRELHREIASRREHGIPQSETMGP